MFGAQAYDGTRNHRSQRLWICSVRVPREVEERLRVPKPGREIKGRFLNEYFSVISIDIRGSSKCQEKHEGLGMFALGIHDITNELELVRYMACSG